MREPFCLRPWEIKKLTPYQVANLYGHPTDERGGLIPKVVGEPPEGDADRIKRKYRERYRLSAAQAERKFAEFLRCEGYRYHLEQQPSAPGQSPEARTAEIDEKVRQYEQELIRGRDD